LVVTSGGGKIDTIKERQHESWSHHIQYADI